MTISFSLTGIGYALTTTMTLTLASEIFPIEKRGEIIGWVMAGMSSSYVMGAFIVPYLQSIGGWRINFIGYMLPSSALSLVLSTLYIPQKIKQTTISSQGSLIDSFKNIFSNKSAFFSLVGLLLAMATFGAVNTYFSSFFREWFDMTIGEVAILMLFGASLYTIGSIVSGRMVNKFGRKKMSVLTVLVGGVIIMSFPRIPNVWISSVCLCVGILFTGMLDTASMSLIVEQLPLYTGVMTSLSRAVTQFGFSIGTGLGGVVLTKYGYQNMFLILGIFAVFSAITFQYFTVDPVQS
jgi:predicted MFS family arabinose efflux permease